ncbi:hypothetical protein JCM8202v2_000140 [Rhodotorula sphaerocarpa]
MHLNHPPPCPPQCDHCLAYDKVTGSLCSQPPSRDSKWCEVHEELQAKLLKSYKRLTCAYEQFDDAALPAGLDLIEQETSLAALKAWSRAARLKWSLAKRVIVARAEHHQQFYAGGDWGHTRYIETVMQTQQKMEIVLRNIEQRAYVVSPSPSSSMVKALMDGAQVTLAVSSASWVLDLASPAALVCDDDQIAANKTSHVDVVRAPSDARRTTQTTPKTGVVRPRNKNGTATRFKRTAYEFSTTSKDVSRDEEDFFAALALTAAPKEQDPHDLLSQLRSYLVPPSDLPRAVTPRLWIAFIEAVFRLVILRVPVLATLVLEPVSPPTSPDDAREDSVKPCGCRLAHSGATRALNSVTALLDHFAARLDADEEDHAGTTTAIESLWRALQYAKTPVDERGPQHGLIDVVLLRDALDSVMHNWSQPEVLAESVRLLGGRVGHGTKPVPWTRECWDLFHQVVGCPGCALVAVRSLSMWTMNRRLALLGRYKDWYTGTTEAERTFHLSDMVLCTSNSCHAGRNVKRIEPKCPDCGKKSKRAHKTVYVEEWEASWMYVKLLSLDGHP